MPHAWAVVSLYYEARDCELAYVIGSIFVSDVQTLGDVVDRKLRLALQEDEDFDASMVGEPFHDALKRAVVCLPCHAPILPPSIAVFCKTLE